MGFLDCVRFANEGHRCFLATVDGDQPRVRALSCWFADETGFYFQTGAPKAIYKQLKKNRKVEACFFAPDPGSGIGKQMRVSGEIEFIDDIALRIKALQDRPFLKQAYGIEKPEDPILVLFRIPKGEVYFWTMESNLKESEIERIKFGS
jgi:pyridoxamine 5'-phosphate oxidase